MALRELKKLLGGFGWPENASKWLGPRAPELLDPLKISKIQALGSKCDPSLQNPPPCRQARQGVFKSSPGGLIPGICLFLRGPRSVSRVTRVLFFELVFGSHFLMTFWSQMIPQRGQVGPHVGSFLESCCPSFPSCSFIDMPAALRARTNRSENIVNLPARFIKLIIFVKL